MTVVPPARRIGPLTQVDVLRFAGASGDFNPLHWDPALAARAGFDAPVAMGQFTAAIMAAWVTDSVGVDRLQEFEIRFVAPVVVGQTLSLTASTTTDEPAPSQTRLALEASTEGGVVARATAVIAD